MIAIGFE